MYFRMYTHQLKPYAISLWVSRCDLPAHTHQLKPYANIAMGEPM